MSKNFYKALLVERVSQIFKYKWLIVLVFIFVIIVADRHLYEVRNINGKVIKIFLKESYLGSKKYALVEIGDGATVQAYMLNYMNVSISDQVVLVEKTSFLTKRRYYELIELDD